MLRTMHLFAGAGGGLLCDLILGHEPVVAVEWDSYCCRVLRERAADGWFPGLSVWEGDVRLFNPSEYQGRVDCIHAGFPCTDLSNAGAKAGLGEGTRSGLYREVLRIAGEMGCPDLFLENVSAILGRGVGVVLGDLAEMGYDAKWLCIRASDVGANHERDRWFCYARHADSKSKPARPINDEMEIVPLSGTVNVAYTYESQCEGGSLSGGVHAEHANLGFGAWWQNQSSVHGVDDGVACGSHRLKAIGNGQVPLQAATAFRLLAG